MEDETGQERRQKPKEPAGRAARLAAALKANIARRKAQAEARGTREKPDRRKDRT